MTLEVEVLGELADLATAIGLVDSDGQFNDDWLSNPSQYLSSVISDPDQREALEAFVEELLETTDVGTLDVGGQAAGRWLPIFTSDSPALTAALIIDDSPTDHIRVGVGVSVSSTSPVGSFELTVPLIRVAKPGQTPLGGMLLLGAQPPGASAGVIEAVGEIEIDSGPATPGEAFLGGLGLRVSLPTDGATPTVAVTVSDLQLPGADTPQDYELSLSNPADLDDQLLELLFGLIDAQATGTSIPSLSDLAALLGLGSIDEAIPPFPIADLAESGRQALVDWLAQLLRDATSATSWFEALGRLLGAEFTGSSDGVTLAIGPVEITATVVITDGAAGQTLLTPRLTISTTPTAGVDIEATADIFTVDTSDASVTALPSLQVGAVLTPDLPAGSDPDVGSICVGLELDSTGRPTLLLVAKDVVIAGELYPMLDLSSPQQIVGAAATVAGDLATLVAGRLGTVGTTVAKLLGLTPLPGVPGLDPARFVQDPIDAVRGWWQTLVSDHRDTAAELIDDLRKLIADAGAEVTVTGNGTEPDPWRFALIDSVDLCAWTHDPEPGTGNDRQASIGICADLLLTPTSSIDLNSQVRATIVTLNLADPAATFLPEVVGSLRATGAGSTSLSLDLGSGNSLTADDVGLAARWTPSSGLQITPSSPALALTLDGDSITLPEFGTPTDLGAFDFDEAAAIAIERLLDLTADRALPDWVHALTRMLGWDGSGRGLRLEELIDNADDALRAWLQQIIAGTAEEARQALLELLAQVINGADDAATAIDGTGEYDDPWRISLTNSSPDLSLALWLLPPGTTTAAPDDVTGLGFGLWLPLDDRSSSPIAISGAVRIAIGEVTQTDTGALDFVVAPRLIASLDLSGRTGALVEIDGDRLGSLNAVTDFPLGPATSGSIAPATTEIVLRDVTVFGTTTAEFVINAADATLLPEIQQILSRLSEEFDRRIGDARVAALVALFEALGLLDDTVGGFVFDAVTHLVLDVRSFVTDSLAALPSANDVVSDIVDLFGLPSVTIDPGDRLVIATGSAISGSAVVAVDIAAGTVTIDAMGEPGSGIPMSWSAHATVSVAGTIDGTIEVGSSDGPLGGLELTGSVSSSPAPSTPAPATPAPATPAPATTASPLQPDAAEHSGDVALTWTLPGGEVVVIHLFPTFAAAGVEDLLRELAPAAALQLILTEIRTQPAVAASVDALLDAIGLLEPPVAGDRRVRFPGGLLRDPIGWLQSSEALGDSADVVLAPLQELVDAIGTLTGLSGSASGRLELAAGFELIASAGADGLALSLDADTAAFATVDTAIGRLAAAGAFSLTLRSGMAPRVGVALAASLTDSPGGGAISIEIDPALRVALSPPTLPSGLTLYPATGGIADLLAVAAGLAVVEALDAVAALAPAGMDPAVSLNEQIGKVVVTLGQALGLTTGPATREFSAPALGNWISDPVDSLSSSLDSILDPTAEAIANALDDLLDPTVGVAFNGTSRTLTIESANVGATVTIGFDPMTVTIAIAQTDLGIIGTIAGECTVSATGLDAFSIEVGPALIDAGPITLAPFASVRRSGASPAVIDVGLLSNGESTSAKADDTGLLVRWDLSATDFTLAAFGGDPTDTGALDTSAESIALEAVDLLIDLIFGFALETEAVDDLLSTTIGTSTISELLRGVVLDDAVAAAENVLIDGLLALDQLLSRLVRFAQNAAAALPPLTIDGLTLQVTSNGSVVGLLLDAPTRIDIPAGELIVSIETDASWIDRPDGVALDDGIQINLIDTSKTDISELFVPSLSVNGVGIRISRASGKLIDGPLSLDSVALHGFGLVTEDEVAGGAHIALKNLAIDLAGGGDNGVAQGILADAQSGDEPVRPGFSPALAVQKHGDGDVMVSLTAGDPPGPWWLAIQRNFGPVYIEQVGLAIVAEDDLEAISVFIDGQVSLFGLTAAVDDLQLTYFVGPESIFDVDSWRVDLGGFAIAADMGGITLAGGLRKFEQGSQIEYIGMLMARFGTYGLSVFGGYSSSPDFASFFVYGALNGPIGGPPAFFVTGIGGGFGINRSLNIPDDLATFDEYPLIKALDPAATPADDILAEIEEIRETFPIEQGQLWFAAGISFTSFALVDGVAVVGIEIGDGLDITLFGLARMALPRPSAALVSIELGLVARFSSSEGVLWVQAQLTDNSWLFHESVRLTGGFAFVSWFSGPRAGQFVLTIGGYHPSFATDGLPVVPRLGFNWQVANNIVIKGESYFALTSEAIMAGGALEASATFGPAYASVIFKADGIVYFDPFSFLVEVSAKIAAGVRVNVLFGTINIRISIGASILIEGPSFRGQASFEVGPVSLTVAFGDSSDTRTPVLTWSEFVPKYLEEASPGVAKLVTALPGKGALPSGPTGESPTDAETADGSVQRPFEVVPEFTFTLTTLAPITELTVGGSDVAVTAPIVSLAPMNQSDTDAELVIRFVNASGNDVAQDFPGREVLTGVFPWGVWGDIPDQTNRKVPKDRVISAPNGIVLDAAVTISGTIGAEVSANRVEIDSNGENLPLPFVIATPVRRRFVNGAVNALGTLVDVSADATESVLLADRWLSVSGRSLTGVAALRGDRVAPPRVGSLTEDLAIQIPRVVPGIAETPPLPGNPETRRPPKITALLSNAIQPSVTQQAVTSVKNFDLARMEAPVLIGSAANGGSKANSPSFGSPMVSGAQLTLIGEASRSAPKTTVTIGAHTTLLSGGVFAAPITALQNALTNQGTNRGPALDAGQIAVLAVAGSGKDDQSSMLTAGASTRMVMIRPGGEVSFDGVASSTDVPRGTAAVAVINVGTKDEAKASESDRFPGWHAGHELPYLGWNAMVASGAVVRSERISNAKVTQGWHQVAHVIDRSGPITTTFADAASTLVVVLDRVGTSNNSAPATGLLVDLVRASRSSSGGKPREPLAIVSGNRAILVYDIETKGGFAVTIDADSGWQLTAVAATALDSERTTARLERDAIETVISTLSPSGTDQARLRWRPTSTNGKA